MGIAFFFSAVTIYLARVTSNFHYCLPSKNDLFHKVNIEWSSSTSCRLTPTIYLLHANFEHIWIECNMQEWIILKKYYCELWNWQTHGTLTGADVWSNNFQKHFLVVFVSYSLYGWRRQKRIRRKSIISLIHIPARFRVFWWRRGEVTWWLQKDILIVSFFGVEVSCWLQKDIIMDANFGHC